MLKQERTTNEQRGTVGELSRGGTGDEQERSGGEAVKNTSLDFDFDFDLPDFDGLLDDLDLDISLDGINLDFSFDLSDDFQSNSERTERK